MILVCVFCLVSFPLVIKCDEAEVEAVDPELETGDPNIDTDNGVPPSPDTDDGAPPTPDTNIGTGNEGTPPPDASSVGHELLQFINDARKKVGSLESLKWDDDLGKRAQDLADTCVKIHEKYNFTGILTYVNKPKNAFSAQTVVKNWLNKKANTDNGDTSACCSESSTSCCRYAKVVSSTFKSGGCGYKFCSNLKLGSKFYPNRQAVICLFSEN